MYHLNHSPLCLRLELLRPTDRHLLLKMAVEAQVPLQPALLLLKAIMAVRALVLLLSRPVECRRPAIRRLPMATEVEVPALLLNRPVERPRPAIRRLLPAMAAQHPGKHLLVRYPRVLSTLRQPQAILPMLA